MSQASTTSGKTERLILIDAMGLIFQGFHAIRTPMTSPTGLPTNALFAFARDMIFLRKQKPDYLICTIDRTEKTFRNEIYPEYKANRDPMPDDLVLQLPHFDSILDAMAIPTLSHPEYEADDVIATLSRQASAKGMEVWICTSDKDCRQLIDDRVQIYSLRKKKLFGRKELEEDWGIAPEQVIDLQTLVGDSVDNVPGVPGVGVKTAAQLLQQYENIENLLAHVEEVKGPKRRENLKNSADVLDLSRSLVTLSTDVPLEFEWEQWRLRDWHEEKLKKLLRDFGLRTLLNQVRDLSDSNNGGQPTLFDAPKPVPPAEEEEELFPFGANVPGDSASKKWRGEYHLINDKKLFADFLQQLQKQSRFAIDLETTGLSPLTCDIVGLAFTWKAEEAWYLAVRGPENEPVLDIEPTLEKLRPILEDPSIDKVNQNIKYDWLVLRANGIQLAGVKGDSMIADYLLHAGERSHSLNDLAARELDHSMIPITDLIGKKTRKQPQLRMDQISPEKVTEYAGEDSDAAWRLCERLEQNLQEESRLWELYQELEIPLIEVLVELEANGIRLDVEYLGQFSDELGKQLEQITEEIYALAGHEFKINSLPQLRQVLFTEMKLPVQKKTNTGEPSTDHETLEKLAAMTELSGHELPKKMLEHRELSKLKSTYVDALPELVNEKTGRIHTSFNQTVAATGRLSSSDPNLQNIPIRREQGQQIRQAFLPEDGWQLLTADYSQIELRLLAHFSGDETLKRAFHEDKDVHTAVAMKVFGVEEKDVTKDMRRSAKTVNFGVIYGISSHGLSVRLGISRDEAAQFIDSYFDRYPKVLQYQTDLLKKCHETGYVSTILGRRRAFDRFGVRPDSKYQQRNQIEREAINMEVQGSAADLIKIAMLNVYRRLRREKLRSRTLLQIHDELVFEVPPEEMDKVPAMVLEEMTGPVAERMKLSVPLKVDLATGPNWLETTPLEV